ncbi:MULTISPECIES: hypothetical protein [Enterobacteriaceae]|uniref:Uncharacterized protein n=2 Tax=root TaxID=1 RepID=A0A7M2QMD8_9ZZZZ|nr:MULTISPECIES: hypothetical protein [Enterobacteriaceae]MCE1279254.1 hypothetical protein [Enterobacter hormaechei]DAF02749.1 MAG TPA: hypothetical protein [Bacteriophage sp.]MCE1315740.1 hypothetical protein [Enterobacter hormaechei]MCJ7341805.1 hypothetical protein [Klebsiella pneumoniae]MDM7040887.1 hypothetical protein [Klebsiella pneumoniae]
MKDFAMPRQTARTTSDKPTFGKVALFCLQAFCVTFTVMYFLVQLYEHAKNIG